MKLALGGNRGVARGVGGTYVPRRQKSLTIFFTLREKDFLNKQAKEFSYLLKKTSGLKNEDAAVFIKHNVVDFLIGPFMSQMTINTSLLISTSDDHLVRGHVSSYHNRCNHHKMHAASSGLRRKRPNHLCLFEGLLLN